MPDVPAWVPVLVLATGVYVALALRLLHYRSGPGTRTIGVCMLFLALWIVSALAEYSTGSLEAMLLAAKTKYSAIALVPPLFLLFLVRHLERLVVRPSHLAALFLIPALTIAVTWTNDSHGWMWVREALDGQQGTRRASWGPWLWRVHLPWSYLLVGTSLVLIAAEWWRESKLHRAQVALLFSATLLPSVVNVLFTLGFFRTEFGATPLALAASSVLYSWGFVRLQLFRASGVAYHAVFAHMQDGVVVVDGFDRVVDLNPAAMRLLARQADAVVGHRVEQLLPDAPGLGEALRARGEAEASFETEQGCRLELAISPILLPSGRLRGRVVMLRDVTERQRAEAALRRSEALVRGIVDGSPNGILRLRPRCDASGEVRDFLCVFANPAAAAWLGKAQIELMGRPFKDAVHPHTPFLFQAFRDVLRTGEACDVERPVRRAGEEHWLRFLAVPAGEDLLVTTVDVTERMQRERELEEAACQDPLTGLLNRRGLEADAAALLGDIAEHPAPAALLYVDLDDFKQINDSLGHEAGDLVLCELAARLQGCTRGPDLLARIGGDEFVLLLPDADAAAAREVAERIAAAVREPIAVDACAVACGVSVGVALAPADGTELKTLLQAADRAMYRAKSGGGGIAAT